MPTIASRILEIARETRCNVFIESGTSRGYSFREALVLGIFARCYTVELLPSFYKGVASRYPTRATQQVFLGNSYEVFREQIFPLCSAEDRIFFWLDGHFSGGYTGGGAFPHPLLRELEVIRQFCPSESLVIAIDDTIDFGRKDLEYLGHNWPTRAEVEAAAYEINPNFHCLDYTGEGISQRVHRGVLVFSYRTPEELG